MGDVGRRLICAVPWVKYVLKSSQARKLSRSQSVSGLCDVFTSSNSHKNSDNFSALSLDPEPTDFHAVLPAHFKINFVSVRWSWHLRRVRLESSFPCCSLGVFFFYRKQLEINRGIKFRHRRLSRNRGIVGFSHCKKRQENIKLPFLALACFVQDIDVLVGTFLCMRRTLSITVHHA